MSYKVKIYLGNFTGKDISVVIGIDIYHVRVDSCPFIFRESQKEPFMVKVSFKSDEPRWSEKKDFDFESYGVISFCASDGEVRFCELESLYPTATLKIID